MDVFLDIGFTLMGGPPLSPPRNIIKCLGLTQGDYQRISDIVFTEYHESVDSLKYSIEKQTNKIITAPLKEKIAELWERQEVEVYEINGARGLIDFLIEQNFNIHIISNLWYPFYNKFLQIFSEQCSFFASETLSFMEGVKKPSQKIFDIALSKSGANPLNSLMIGDTIEDDIIPCAKLGMSCIWFKSRIDEVEDINIERRKFGKYKNIYEIDRLEKVPSILLELRKNEDSRF